MGGVYVHVLTDYVAQTRGENKSRMQPKEKDDTTSLQISGSDGAKAKTRIVTGAQWIPTVPVPCCPLLDLTLPRIYHIDSEGPWDGLSSVNAPFNKGLLEAKALL